MKGRKKFPFLHLAMFVFTVFATIVAGALQRGINILNEPGRVFEGLPFSIALIGILLTHELAHYFTSRKHGVEATLPFFIPAPSIIGTFGAFIKMKSPIRSREALIDIGASGPIAGFIAALIASIYGLRLSKIIIVDDPSGTMTLGNSILFSLLSRFLLGHVPFGYDVLLHPIAFAGWIGFFVTSLNLIPVGQLDGGHIAFALLGRKHKTVSLFLIGLMAVLGTFVWLGWFVWAILLIILGVKHPPILSGGFPLDKKRRTVSLMCLFIFVLTFIPAPFSLSF
jgi:membrane-associated protease RseP (regulator of RpoE activity)